MKSLLVLPLLSLSIYINAQTNFKYLDINQVKAGISNTGTMHSDPSGTLPSYEVPVGGGVHCDHTSSFWIGGFDSGNQLHLAAQTYRQAGDDFWPGPLDTTNASISAATSSQYNKIWKLNRTDINAFISNFSNGNVQNGSYTPVYDLLFWPAQGTGAQTKNMAPFVDVNNNHIYDPLVGGDYPIIKGDQTLYYIFNDNLVHGSSGGTPLKVEIHATAYAYGNSAIANQYGFLSKATFYNYKIINRSSANYINVTATLFSDADLGYFGDDYIGCDVAGNYGFVYNGDGYDENGYLANIPAAGYQVLKGPLMVEDGIDNNRNGLIDEPCEQQLMSGFTYYSNSFAGVPIQQTDPQNAAEYNNYMHGQWRNSSPFTCGGNAFGGTIATQFAYPGISYNNSQCGTPDWSEITAVNTPNDRRFMINIGPFNFNSGSTTEIEYVHCTSFPSGGNTAVLQLKTDMSLLKNFSDVFLPSNCNVTSVSENHLSDLITIFPNPATTELNVSFAGNENKFSDVVITDVCGKTLLHSYNDESNLIRVDISKLANGIYFLKADTKDKSIVRKFIKE